MPLPRLDELVPPWRWGIFLRKPCAGLLLNSSTRDYEALRAIYQALKSMGFKETYWQLVYPGQVGGLVKSPRGGLIEFHVRFYGAGMIYAEVELGRSVFIHFLNHRYYLNDYLIRTVQRRLAPGHIDYLIGAINRYKISHIKSWPEWSSQNRFMTHDIKKRVRFLAALSDWRLLAFIMLASITATVAKGLLVLPLLTVIGIVVYLLAPRRS